MGTLKPRMDMDRHCLCGTRVAPSCGTCGDDAAWLMCAHLIRYQIARSSAFFRESWSCPWFLLFLVVPQV